jgi:hypothetical protein
LKLIKEEKLEEQESITLEVLLVRKQESKKLEENKLRPHKFLKAPTLTSGLFWLLTFVNNYGL